MLALGEEQGGYCRAMPYQAQLRPTSIFSRKNDKKIRFSGTLDEPRAALGWPSGRQSPVERGRVHAADQAAVSGVCWIACRPLLARWGHDPSADQSGAPLGVVSGVWAAVQTPTLALRADV